MSGGPNPFNAVQFQTQYYIARWKSIVKQLKTTDVENIRKLVIPSEQSRRAEEDDPDELGVYLDSETGSESE
jgi:hypothetical protein